MPLGLISEKNAGVLRGFVDKGMTRITDQNEIHQAMEETRLPDTKIKVCHKMNIIINK